MLTERFVYDQITIMEEGQIQLRKARIISDDEVELNRIFHREVISPGDDVSLFPERVRDIAKVVWTDDVVSKFLVNKKSRELAMIADLKERI